MSDLVDIYKNLEGGTLFHTKLRKLRYEEGRLFLSSTPLAKRFLLVGDVVNIGYANFLLPARVVGKNENLVANIFYAGEGKLGDRSKPRVPVQREYSFKLLLKFEGVFRAFDPVDISEGGFSLIIYDSTLVPLMVGKQMEFKITGREELYGACGMARLVGILEDGQMVKLAFEADVDDVSATKIRLYVINTIKRLLGA